MGPGCAAGWVGEWWWVGWWAGVLPAPQALAAGCRQAGQAPPGGTRGASPLWPQPQATHSPLCPQPQATHTPLPAETPCPHAPLLPLPISLPTPTTNQPTNHMQVAFVPGCQLAANSPHPSCRIPPAGSLPNTQVAFVTNNSTRSRGGYVAKFESLGIQAEEVRGGGGGGRGVGAMWHSLSRWASRRRR